MSNYFFSLKKYFLKLYLCAEKKQQSFNTASNLPSCSGQSLLMRYINLLILALLASALALTDTVAWAQQGQPTTAESLPDTRVGLPIGDRISNINQPPSLVPAGSRLRRTNIREVFELRKKRRQVQRFEGMGGLQPFILDKTGKQALFRYERGGEVLVLTTVHTTRGDTLYKNDQGVIVLHLRRVGSATIFLESGSHGLVAWATGSAQKLGPPQVSMSRMKNVLEQIANDLASLLEKDIEIEVIGATETTAWIFLDTARNVRIGIGRVVQSERSVAQLSSLKKIKITATGQPKSVIDGATLRLSITPALGFAGRQSSLQIQSALLGSDRLLFHAELPVLTDSDEGFRESFPEDLPGQTENAEVEQMAVAD